MEKTMKFVELYKKTEAEISWTFHVAGEEEYEEHDLMIVTAWKVWRLVEGV